MKISEFSRACAIAALVLAGAAACGDDEPAPDRVTVAAEVAGQDPFTGDFSKAAPGALKDFTLSPSAASGDPIDITTARNDAARKAAKAAGWVLWTGSGKLTVALYKASGSEACDIDGMAAELAADTAKAAAWANVQAVEAAALKKYLSGLTQGWLAYDAEAMLFGWREGKPVATAVTLTRGTAVLVDRDGNLRARCRSGHALNAAYTALDGKGVDARAFADAVVDSKLGPGIEKVRMRLENAVGPPDCSDQPRCLNNRDVSIGDADSECQFYVVLQFVDNYLVNGPGDDLRVVEIGEIEPTDVFVKDGDKFVRVGKIEGGDSRIDLSPALPADSRWTEVRLCDVPNDEPGSSPGADIDAVAALNWARR